MLGAPQTIDQQDLFGRSVKWSHDIEVPPDPREAIDLATRMWVEAMSPPPVRCTSTFGSTSRSCPRMRSPPPPMAFRTSRSVDANLTSRRSPHWRQISRGGAASSSRAPTANRGWRRLRRCLPPQPIGRFSPTLSVDCAPDTTIAPMSSRHRTPSPGRDFSMPPNRRRSCDSAAFPRRNRSGSGWGNHREVPQVFIEPAGWRDPTFSASVVLRSEVVPTLHLLAKAMGDTTETSWMTRWQNADRAAAAAVTGVIEGNPFPNEPMVARIVSQALPDPGVLWVASSMPVRDLDAVMLPTERRVRVLANRGANGIDGFVSTALGSGAVSGVATVALAGDLSMLHDLSALATAARLDLPVTIVAVNNDGGGIFHLLPQAGHDHFERHWGTPHGLDLAAVATALGVESETVSDASRLTGLVSTPPAGPRFIEVRTDRTANADLHRRIRSAVVESLAQI